MAQSALSQHMRKLEAELGVQLLLRTDPRRRADRSRPGLRVGYRILPLPTVRDEIARGELQAIAIGERRISRTIDLAKASDRRQSPAVVATVRILEDCVRRQRRAAAAADTSVIPIPASRQSYCPGRLIRTLNESRPLRGPQWFCYDATRPAR